MKPKSKWLRPKYILNEVLTYLSIISLCIALMGFFSYYVWINDTSLFSNLDYDFHNRYTLHIKKFNKKIEDSKSENEKFNNYLILIKELDGITALHKHYPMFINANKFIVDKLINDKKYKQAENFSFKWQKKYPYEFFAKFKYAKALEKTDKLKLFHYYNDLYNKHKSFKILVSKFVDFLLRDGKFDLAFKIAKEANSNFIYNYTPEFLFFFKDSTTDDYNLLDTDRIKFRQYTKINGKYSISYKKVIEDFKGILFEFSHMNINSIIKNIKLDLKSDKKVFRNIEIKEFLDLDETQNSVIITGPHPGFDFEVPSELIGYTGTLEMNLSFIVDDNSKFVINKILNNPQWKIKTSSDKDESIYPFKIETVGTKLYSDISIKPTQTSLIEIMVAPYQGMTIHHLSVTLNNEKKLTYQDIFSLSGLKNGEIGKLIVTNDKPKVIFQLKKEIIINEIHIDLELGNHVK